MKKLLLVILLSSSCATFRHSSIPVAERITTILEEISIAADTATNTGLFTREQRQQFAKEVMLPAITATQGLAGCLLSNKCSQLPLYLTTISQCLLKAVNQFASALPDSTVKRAIIEKSNVALVYVNNLYVKVGGK